MKKKGKTKILNFFLFNFKNELRISESEKKFGETLQASKEFVF